jgi:hypothetical protein
MDLKNFMGRAIQGQKKTVGTETTVDWDFDSDRGNAILITGEDTSPSDGRLRIAINKTATTGAIAAYPSFETASEMIEPVYRHRVSLIPAGNQNIKKLSIHNPGTSAAQEVAVSLFHLEKEIEMSSYEIVAATSITLTTEVEAEIDWTTFAADQYGDLITITTNDSGGANETRIVHNAESALADPTADGEGAVAHIYSYFVLPVPHDKNIRTTALRQDSGGNLNYYVTKWRRV